MPPPEKTNLAGWYEAGTTPGERGTAIVAGHVDNAEGPAVFYYLGALTEGPTIEIDAQGRQRRRLHGRRERGVRRDDFPDKKVYGAARRRAAGHHMRRQILEETGYQGNVVVFAHLTSVR